MATERTGRTPVTATRTGRITPTTTYTGIDRLHPELYLKRGDDESDYLSWDGTDYIIVEESTETVRTVRTPI